MHSVAGWPQQGIAGNLGVYFFETCRNKKFAKKNTKTGGGGGGLLQNAENFEFI